MEVEVATKQSKLPELIRNVLTHVRDRSVGPDDDLEAGFVATVRLSAFGLTVFDLHHPAACLISRLLQKEGACLFEYVEGSRPEIKAENVTLPAQQVVLNI